MTQTLSNQVARAPRWVRFAESAARFGVTLAGIIIVAMAVNVIADVASRNLMGRGLPGTLEIVSYLWMPALSILPLGYAQIRDEQIRATLMVDKASRGARRLLDTASELVTAIVVVWLLFLSTQALLHSMEIGEAPAGALWLLAWPGRLAIVLGLLVFLLGAAARIYKLFAMNLEPHDVLETEEGSVVD